MKTLNGVEQYKTEFQAVVAQSGDCDYATLQAAVAAGATSIFIRNGTYTLDAELVIPDGTVIVGQTQKGVIIDEASLYRMTIMGDGGGSRYKQGAVRLTSGSVQVDPLYGERVDGATDLANWNTVPIMAKRTFVFNGAVRAITDFAGVGAHLHLAKKYAGPSINWEGSGYVDGAVNPDFSDNSGYAIATELASNALSNFSVINPAPVSSARNGAISCASVHDLLLDRLRVIGTGTAAKAAEPIGIAIAYCESVTIRNCRVTDFGATDGDNTEAGVDLWAGISVYFSKDVVIDGNNITNCYQNGIFTRGCNHARVTNNQVYDCSKAGIWDCESAHINTSLNDVTNCWFGIVPASSDANIHANNITDCYQGILESEWPERVHGLPHDAAGLNIVTGDLGSRKSIMGNILRRCRLTGIRNGGTGSAITGNVILEQGYIRNGDFREWIAEDGVASRQPYNWAAVTGTWGTTLLKHAFNDGVNPAFNPYHLEFTRADQGPDALKIKQFLRYPLVVGATHLHAISLWVRMDAATTGNLVVKVYDAADDLRVTLTIADANLSATEWRSFCSAEFQSGAATPGGYMTIETDTMSDPAGFHIDGVRLTTNACCGITAKGKSTITGNILEGAGAVLNTTPGYGAAVKSSMISTTWRNDGDIINNNYIENCGALGVGPTLPRGTVQGNRIRGFLRKGVSGGVGPGFTALEQVITGNVIDGITADFTNWNSGVYLTAALNVPQGNIVGQNRIMNVSYPINCYRSECNTFPDNIFDETASSVINGCLGGKIDPVGCIVRAPTVLSTHDEAGDDVFNVRVSRGGVIVGGVQKVRTTAQDVDISLHAGAAIPLVHDGNSTIIYTLVMKGADGTVVKVDGTEATAAAAVEATDAAIDTAVGSHNWTKLGTTTCTAITDATHMTQTYRNVARDCG